MEKPFILLKKIMSVTGLNVFEKTETKFHKIRRILFYFVLSIINIVLFFATSIKDIDFVERFLRAIFLIGATGLTYLAISIWYNRSQYFEVFEWIKQKDVEYKEKSLEKLFRPFYDKCSKETNFITT